MPVSMVRVDQSVVQQQSGWQADLEKLYGQRWAVLLEQQEPATSFLAAALFNDHLLGAVRVTADAEGWWLSDLQVREVTRQRGVATRLLALLVAEARQAQQPLRIDASLLDDVQQAFFLQRGFVSRDAQLLSGWTETC